MKRSRHSAITVQNRHGRWPVDGRRLQSIGEAALTMLRPDATAARATAQGLPEVGVLLVGRRRMAILNERYLGHAGATDVITFDYAGPPKPDPPSPGRASLHGDIFICLEEAQRQAEEFGTSWQEEVVRYLVHGLLHLHGLDDLEPKARRRMKRAENRIVRRLAAEFAFKRLGKDASVAA